ncbi:MAG: hypothetical protein V1858_05250, partial [Candidatus Gottesmanbacteria bacterium]
MLPNPIYAVIPISSSFGQMDVKGDIFPGPIDSNREVNPQAYNRTWTEVNEHKGLVCYGYPSDQPPDVTGTPLLSTLVGTDPNESGAFTRTYKVDGGNWPVSFLCLKSPAGQSVLAPEGVKENAPGYNYMVLYADEHFITLSNGEEDMQDNPQKYGAVLPFYILHLSNINVDPALVALYRQLNASGRHNLPAIKSGQVIGTSQGPDVCVSIRDSDDFNDPRSRLDWWHDFPDASCIAGTGPSSSANKPGVIFQSKKRSPDDQEIGCQRIEYASGPGNDGAYIYTDKNGLSYPEMRTDANLNFESRTRGVHCGQTKSQPIVVTETSSFDINEGEICKNTWWRAEISMNYDNNTNNFR